MGTPPAKIVHPLHTDGAQTMRPRLGCQLLILVLPFFVWAIEQICQSVFGTWWGRLPSAMLLVFGLVVLSWGALYLIAQYTTRIRLWNQLSVASVFSTWRPLELEPHSLRGFRRQVLTGAEKLRLQLLVGVLAAVVSLGCLVVIGFVLLFLLFGPGKIRSEAALHSYMLAALFLMIETVVHGLAALSIIPTAWRVWQSDGVVLIWRQRSLGHLGWLFGPADLRIFARQNELDTLEEWLTEHEVARLPG